MNNIPINEAETIFEPYWDSGESYPCKRKYSVFQNYAVEYHPKAVAQAKPAWCNVSVEVERGAGTGEPSCTLSRDCHLILDGYDLLQLNAGADEKTRVTVTCVIDGHEVKALDFYGLNENHEMVGEICGHEMTRFTISVYSEGNSSVRLFWMGLANRAKQREMEQRTSGYSTEWEGCFEESPRSLEPRIGMVMTSRELEQMREKRKHPPFDRLYQVMKQKAEQYLTRVPEEDIGEYIKTSDIRWIRDRDRGGENPAGMMKTLAFVGAVEQNEPMLRLACRTALSVACTKNWCEGIMGAFPGATWHHRSFTEDCLLSACACVLDLAGHLLTWHGRNIIHNAMILKGLSRMDCDFHIMEYIHHMNQGIVFCHGRIAALIALAYDYPRFRSRVDEGEAVLKEALENYIYPDGGTPEGPGYWNYTISEALVSYYLLAKYRKENYEDYLPDCLKKTERYALAMLSTAGDGDGFMGVNDAHGGPYAFWIAAVYSRVGEHQEKWRKLYQKYCGKKDPGLVGMYHFLLGETVEPQEMASVADPGFWNLTCIGQVGYLSQTEDAGLVHFHAVSGPNFFSHCHSDNGSVLLEAGGEVLLMDRGICAYSSPFTDQMALAKSHNLFLPINPSGLSYNQIFTGGGKVTESCLENGVWRYTAELTGTWKKGLYTCNYRRIFSPDSHLYLVMDEVAYQLPHASAFLFCTNQEVTTEQNGVCIQGEKVQARVLPMNWNAEISRESFGEKEGKEVKRVWMTAQKAPFHRVITVIEVASKGESRLELQGSRLLWGGISLTAEAGDQGFVITMGDRTYTAAGDRWEIQ
ncbi:MAG: hypothetical protein SO147_06990 [Clostridia bacterium]|nr:hypothetical protein [Clostridia bacterium]